MLLRKAAGTTRMLDGRQIGARAAHAISLPAAAAHHSFSSKVGTKAPAWILIIATKEAFER